VISWIELEPLVCQIGILAILAMSLNVICGMTGLLQLGHAGFYAAGAYAAGLAAIYATFPGLGPGNFALGAAAAVLVAVAFSLLIGVPCLRLRGDYLAIATLGFAEILRLTLNNLTFPRGAMFADRQESLGGPTGIGFTEAPGKLWPAYPDYSAGYARWWFIWLVALAVYVLLRNVKFSRVGRACLCIREDEIAARTMGINVPGYKLLAFMLSAACAGLAGALFFHYRLRITPNDFQLMTSIEVLLMVVLGGMGSISGSLIAAVLLGALPTVLSHIHPELSQYRQILYAALLVVLIRLAPDGLLGQYETPGWARSLLGGPHPGRREDRA
jgi:branched-chain amino acid transport system permease protein